MILKNSQNVERGKTAAEALREAGIEFTEVLDWEAAAHALRDADIALILSQGAVVSSGNSDVLKKAVAALAQSGSRTTDLPTDTARALSHELRTPLSAMAGWLHLMESGKLDAEAMKRAMQKLHANIDDQVRTIDRFLSANSTGRK